MAGSKLVSQGASVKTICPSLRLFLRTCGFCAFCLFLKKGDFPQIGNQPCAFSKLNKKLELRNTRSH